jgi:nucleotide sugar dehydrogenase
VKIRNVAIAGLWHQGLVLAVSLAQRGYKVFVSDLDSDLINNLKNGQLSVQEPHLLQNFLNFQKSTSITVIDKVKDLPSYSTNIIISIDIDINDFDEVQLEKFYETSKLIIDNLTVDTVIINTSQVPCGTTRTLLDLVKTKSHLISNLLYIPENLQLGKALESFKNPGLHTIGILNKEISPDLIDLVCQFSPNPEYFSIETAELVKHSLNAFLGINTLFGNAVSDISEQLRLNPYDVISQLRNDPRVGNAPRINPGLWIGGGTIPRDFKSLSKLSNDTSNVWNYLYLLNNQRRNSLINQINCIVNGTQKTVGFYGLTYKNGTSTLRKSPTLQVLSTINSICTGVYDEEADNLPPKFNNSIRFLNLREFVLNCDLIVIMKSHNLEFLMNELRNCTSEKIVIDCFGITQNLVIENKNLLFKRFGEID